MQQYLDLIKDVIANGVDRPDRTGTGTRAVFHRTLRFDMADGFPLVTTKKVPFRLPLLETLWFLSGSGNNNDLLKDNVTIWNEWAGEDGDLGRIYGVQWRDWQGPKGSIDQVQQAVDAIRFNPTSRRIIVNAWNPGELETMALPPCHYNHQIFVDTVNGKLNLLMNQRSCDIGLGLPFNIAGYAALLHMYAHVAGYKAGELAISLCDTHIYLDHLPALQEQLNREPRPMPKLTINRQVDSMFDFKLEDFTLEGYDPHPHIRMNVSV